MKSIVLFLFLALPVRAQFLVPDLRGVKGNSHAEWDIFTKASFEKNFPDLVPDEDASITSSTGSAFITSSGNLYSFQAPIAFQLDDTTDLEVRSVFLQLASLGTGLDREKVRLLVENEAGEVTAVVNPSQIFVASQEELTGEMGGIGTTYGVQWDLRETPLTGKYSILMSANATSLSVDRVSLDLSETFEKIKKPEPLRVEVVGNEVVVSWFGGRLLESSVALNSGWAVVPGSQGVNRITLPIANGPCFFRLRQVVVPE